MGIFVVYCKLIKTPYVMLNMSKFMCKKSGSLTTNFVDSRIFKLKNLKIYSLAREHCRCQVSYHNVGVCMTYVLCRYHLLIPNLILSVVCRKVR